MAIMEKWSDLHLFFQSMRIPHESMDEFVHQSAFIIVTQQYNEFLRPHFFITPSLQCGDMFSSKASLSVHHERRHGIKVAKKKCFVCAEILDAQDVKQHILNAHPGALPEDDVTREETKVDEDHLGESKG